MRAIPNFLIIGSKVITAIAEFSSTDHSRNRTTDKRIRTAKIKRKIILEAKPNSGQSDWLQVFLSADILWIHQVIKGFDKLNFRDIISINPRSAMKKLNTSYGIYDNHKIYCEISSIFLNISIQVSCKNTWVKNQDLLRIISYTSFAP